MGNSTFKLSFIGGGSNFVATLGHAIYEQRDTIAQAGYGLEIRLMDISLPAAARMKRYLDLIAGQCPMPLQVTITDSLEGAVADADLVILAAGQGKSRFLDLIGEDTDVENTPRVAAAAATEWPLIARIARALRETNPEAYLVTITNPTDTLASWAQRIYGIRCAGMCMEVPNFRATLSHLLGVPQEAVELRHIGVNHFGMTSEFLVDGEDGFTLLQRDPSRFTKHPDYQKFWDWWIALAQGTGHFRSSAAHRWPLCYDWPSSPLRDPVPMENYTRVRQELYRAIDQAVESGTLLGEAGREDAIRLANGGHYQKELLSFPSAIWTFGTLVTGLMGVDGGPCPLQVRNGSANGYLPEDAWLEIPVKFIGREPVPQSVKPIPEYQFAHLRDVITMRLDLSDWFVTGDSEKLRQALYRWPEGGEIQKVYALFQELAAWRGSLTL